MNPEQLLADKAKKPDFCAISGSRLYGTNRPESDYDYRGFILPPYQYLINSPWYVFKDSSGLGVFSGDDSRIYSLIRYIELVMAGDPNCTELLFAPKDKIITISVYGQKIIDNKRLFLSKKIYRRIIGYGYSEWRKAFGWKMEDPKRTKTDDEVINDIRNVFGPDKADMDNVIDILMSNRERVLVPNRNNLGEKRKKEFEQFGFGVSSAAHSIRLSQELDELLLTGNITFPRPNAEFLLDIRKGLVSAEEATRVYEESTAKVKNSFTQTTLPGKPDVVAIRDLYMSIVDDHLNDVYNPMIE